MVVHSFNVLTADWTEINNVVKSDAKNVIISWIIAENRYLISDANSILYLKRKIVL